MNPLSIKTAIHTISAVLEIPAILLLIAAVLVVVFESGSVLVEYFTDRRGKRARRPTLPARSARRELPPHQTKMYPLKLLCNKEKERSGELFGKQSQTPKSRFR